MSYKPSSLKRSSASLILALLFAISALFFITGCSDSNSSQDTTRNAEPAFFLHISDTHFGLEGGSGELVTKAFLTEVAPVVNPLITIHTGDVTNYGGELAAWKSYHEVFAGSNLIDLLGNHDVKPGKPVGDPTGRANFFAYSQTAARGGSFYGLTHLDSAAGVVRLIRTDTNESPTNVNLDNIAGYFSYPQQQMLLNYPGISTPSALNVVLGHHPIAGENQIKTGNELMKELILKTNAPLYLCGHVHVPTLTWVGNTLMVQANDFGKNGPQSSFYLVAYDGGSPAAKEVKIDATKSPSVNWPIVFITAPANSTLGNSASYTAGNPYAKAYISSQPAPTLRVMVFSPGAITSAEYSIGDGPWKPLINSAGRVWESQLSLLDLQAGSHTVKVRASSNGQVGEDSITIKVQ